MEWSINDIDNLYLRRICVLVCFIPAFAIVLIYFGIFGLVILAELYAKFMSEFMDNVKIPWRRR